MATQRVEVITSVERPAPVSGGEGAVTDRGNVGAAGQCFRDRAVSQHPCFGSASSSDGSPRRAPNSFP